LRNKFYLVLAIIITILLSSCMRSNDKGKEIEKKEKAPETLSKVSESLDNLLMAIDSIEELMKLSESEFQAINSKDQESEKKDEENKEQSSEGSQQNGQQQNQGQQNQGQNNGKQRPRTKDEELIMRWKKIDKDLEEIHKSWNSYEVEAIDKGVTAEKGDEFKRNLNSLTVAVENRDIASILDTASKAFNSLSTFFDLYKDEVRGELSRVKYSVHQAFILAQNGNKEEANKLLTETQEPISRMRQKLKEDKMKDLEKLSLAITDMQKALDSNSIELLKIKRDIAIENIKLLQE